MNQLRKDFIRDYKPVNHKTVPNLIASKELGIMTILKNGSVESCKRMWTESFAGYQDTVFYLFTGLADMLPEMHTLKY